MPQSATLEYGVDDDGSIFVNGALVVSNHDGIADGGLVDTGACLVADANVIAFTATEPEPSTYAMLLLGLGAFGMVRHRPHREC